MLPHIFYRIMISIHQCIMKRNTMHQYFLKNFVTETYGYQCKVWGMNWETGIDGYTLLCVKQITSKSLLYGTGNSAQYCLMTYMGKESKKRVHICVCVTDTLCCREETT